MDTYTQPVAPKRQYRTLEERRRIVEETLAERASVVRVVRANGVNANLVFNWRRLHQVGRLGDSGGAKLLPVKGTAESSPGSDNFAARIWLLATTLAGHDLHPTAACAGAHRKQHRCGFIACVGGVPPARVALPLTRAPGIRRWRLKTRFSFTDVFMIGRMVPAGVRSRFVKPNLRLQIIRPETRVSISQPCARSVFPYVPQP